MRRYVIDWGKIATISLLLSWIGVLALAGKVSGDLVTAVFFTAAGYTFGNGVQARRRRLPSPIVGPEFRPDESGPA